MVQSFFTFHHQKVPCSFSFFFSFLWLLCFRSGDRGKKLPPKRGRSWAAVAQGTHDDDDDDEVLLNVLRCQLTYQGQVVTNAEAWFNNSLRPRKPEGSLGTDSPGRPPPLSHSSWTMQGTQLTHWHYNSRSTINYHGHSLEEMITKKGTLRSSGICQRCPFLHPRSPVQNIDYSIHPITRNYSVNLAHKKHIKAIRKKVTNETNNQPKLNHHIVYIYAVSINMCMCVSQHRHNAAIRFTNILSSKTTVL